MSLRVGLQASFVGLLSLAIVGCSASGPTFTPLALEGDQAAVYVYRPGSSYVGCGVVLPIELDGERIGKLRNNGYACKAVAPGKHEVSSKTESTSKVPFVAEAHKSYYIQAGVQMGLFVGRPNLIMVPEETGKLAILGTKRSSP